MGAENVSSVTEFTFEGLTNDRSTQILLFIVILIIYLVTVAGNLVIILLVQVDSSLHTPMYFFLTNLSGLEICYVTSTVPQMLAHLLAGNGVISFTRCAAQMYFSLSLGCTECILLAAMAYDRYLAICRPLVYTVAMSRGQQWQLATASWAGGFLIAMVDVVSTLQLPFCGTNRINHFCCEVPMVLKLACGNIRVIEFVMFVVAALILLVPLSVILTSYGLILSSVLQMKSATGMRKALSTCTSHLVVVTLFYGTIISMYMKPQSGTAPDLDKKIAIFYIVVTPLLNPIIYTLRNKDTHRAVAKVLRRWGWVQKAEL
ncbi:olfactory receptor 2D2-like [Hemicordylus capensis]|uniref:olfactory receptor 2D2-like n=1 Tax=Hemicordylus capensis TaxID=884348 RepID=UPI002303BEF7|nr:olfactory receptor 2D2-like [Hemicordylus capensis]